MRSIILRLTVPSIAAIAVLQGCAGKSDPQASGSPPPVAPTFNAQNPGAGWVEATDPNEQQRLIAEMWQVLGSTSCWDASAIVDAIQPVGNLSQYTFHGNFEYRYAGFSTHFGPLAIYAIGTYQGYLAAIVETWSGELEGIIILDGATIEHVMPTPARTGWFSVRFGASAGPCL